MLEELLGKWLMAAKETLFRRPRTRSNLRTRKVICSCQRNKLLVSGCLFIFIYLFIYFALMYNVTVSLMAMYFLPNIIGKCIMSLFNIENI